ncbi:hypothetical protein VNO80_05523 [Phaseolus coccineus]|uniref:Uncharacterized protein n=1 Tax=Phaseolus coccineus TaxID=3886 RepID=A0AAN9RN32_PHACN
MRINLVTTCSGSPCIHMCACLTIIIIINHKLLQEKLNATIGSGNKNSVGSFGVVVEAVEGRVRVAGVGRQMNHES